jgi:hypothetical protein
VCLFSVELPLTGDSIAVCALISGFGLNVGAALAIQLKPL